MTGVASSRPMSSSQCRRRYPEQSPVCNQLAALGGDCRCDPERELVSVPTHEEARS